MKRFLSILVAVAMTISMVLPVFAYTDTAADDHEAAILHLSGLGVINGYEDGSFQPDKVVTRAEMAKLLVVILGLDAGADLLTGESGFADVATSHWAIGYINVATSYGLIKGDGDGNFRPDDTVNYAEAATMAIRALGYQTVVEKAGQWPTNYLNKANELKLFEDVADSKASDGAKRGEVAQILWNMLGTDMWEVVSENENNGLTSTADRKMMTVKFPYYSLVELDVRTGATYNVEVIDEDTIEICGIEYDGVNPLDLFSGEVFESIVYKKDKVEKGMSLYINAYDEDMETTAVVGRVSKFEVNKVYVNGKAYKFESAALNADATKAAAATVANAGKVVRIVLDKNNKVAEFEALTVDTQFVVDTVKADKENNVTYKGYVAGQSLEVKYDDAAMYVTIDEAGVASFAKASDIVEGTVLAEVFDSEITGRLFVVMNEKVAGKLEKIEAGRLVVAGNSYAMASEISLKYASKDDPEADTYELADIQTAGLVGEEVTVTLDANNVVVFMEADDKLTPSNYGFITKVFTNAAGEEPVVRVKVVGLDGVATTYDAYDFKDDEQVEEDDFDDYLTAKPNVKLVQFELKNGKIDMSSDKGIKLTSDTVKALTADSEADDVRKTIDLAGDGATIYVTTSSTKILNVGFDSDDKFVINTVTFDDIKDEVKDTDNRVILTKANGVKLDYVIIPGTVTTEPNYAIVVSNDIAIEADDKFYADIYDVTTGETLTHVEVASASVGDYKGAIVTYTKNGEGIYTFSTVSANDTVKASAGKLTVEAGEGYTKINGNSTGVIVKDDVITVVYLDENLNIVADKDMSDIDENYEIYVAKEVSTTDDAAKIIIVVEK